MPVYNAAIPILEAYMKGAQLKLEREKAAEHAQILKDQLEEQKAYHKSLADQAKQQHELNVAKSNLEKQTKIYEGIAKGTVPLPANAREQQPAGVTPTGAYTQMPTGETPGTPRGEVLADAASQVPVGGDLIEAPMLSEPPVAPVRMPEMQTREAIKPGTMIDGVDVSRATLPEDAARMAATAEGLKQSAIEGAKRPGVLEERTFKEKTAETLAKTNAEAAQLKAEAAAAKAEADRKFKADTAKLNRESREKLEKERNRLYEQNMNLTDARGREANAIARKRVEDKATALKEANEGVFDTFAPQVARGEHSLQELGNLIVDKNTRAKFIQDYSQRGYTFLDKEQVKALPGLQRISQFYEKNKELADDIAKMNAGQIAWDYDLLDRRQKQIIALLEPFARDQDYKGVITDPEQDKLKAYVTKMVGTKLDKQNAISLNGIADILENTKTKWLNPQIFKKSPASLQQYIDLMGTYDLAPKKKIEVK